MNVTSVLLSFLTFSLIVFSFWEKQAAYCKYPNGETHIAKEGGIPPTASENLGLSDNRVSELEVGPLRPINNH